MLVFTNLYGGTVGPLTPSRITAQENGENGWKGKEKGRCTLG